MQKKVVRVLMVVLSFFGLKEINGYPKLMSFYREVIF